MNRNDFLRAIASVLEQDGFIAEANDSVWRDSEFAVASFIRSANRLPSTNEIADEIRPYVRASMKVAEKQILNSDGIVTGVAMTQDEVDKALSLGLAHYDTLGGLRAFTMDGVDKVLVEVSVVDGEDEATKVAKSLYRTITGAADELAMLADGELDEAAFFEDEPVDEAPTKLVCDMCGSGEIQRIVEAGYEYDSCGECGEYYPI